MKIKEGPNRIPLIDEIRGIAILGMLVVHSVFYTEMIFARTLSVAEWPLFRFIAIFGGGLFIFISGVSCSFAKSNIRRGLVCLGFGLAISSVTYFLWKGLELDDTFVFFGILHLLGVSMILFGLTQNAVKKINPWGGLIAFSGLFAVSYLMVYRSLWESAIFQSNAIQKLYDLNLLYLAGYPNWSFFPPIDFYPLLPWALLFFAGGFAGILIVSHKVPDWARRSRVRFLSFCGQHTLAIYLIHPIILYPAIMLIHLLLK